MALLNRDELFRENVSVFDFEAEPDVIVVANLRRDDAFAHVLAVSPLLGNFPGVFAAVDGDAHVAQEVLDAVCALDAEVLAIGGPELVTDAAIAAVQQASAGHGCAAG